MPLVLTKDPPRTEAVSNSVAGILKLPAEPATATLRFRDCETYYEHKEELERYLYAHETIVYAVVGGAEPLRALPVPIAAPAEKKAPSFLGTVFRKAAPCAQEEPPLCKAETYTAAIPSLDDELSHLDESFSEMVLRKIDEKNMTDVECYKRANADRKLFSKLRDKHYRPSKRTAVAFGIALSLPLCEMNELLRKAGYALSKNTAFDVIVEYYVKNEMYDVMDINETLYSYDQPLLGL